MVAHHTKHQCGIRSETNMACKLAFFFVAALLAVAFAAPAEKVEKEDLVAGEKEDLQTAASHWGGHYGGWGGYGYGYYPHYGYWGWPSYGYGYGYGWPYGYYGHHGYWW
ncbi:uncharacterized protein [Epargyreus clarus]|uniref:uncharacterized protein n=1 Tax=Epargyreus clarus TaxID=520877 RepID=UPI003C2E2118